MSLGFWIGAGARDEPDAKAGVSHFIEHLLFKGTRSYDAQQIAEIFDEMGGELNAATSREHTVVYARVPDRHLEDALDVMADMVFSPAFAELDSEREVVLEEIAMVEDAPQDLVHDLLSEAVFAEPSARPPGDRPRRGDLVDRPPRRSPRYHRRAYVAGNIVLAAAGNLEHDAAAAPARAGRPRSASSRRRGARRVRSPLVREPRARHALPAKDTEQFHVCVGAPGHRPLRPPPVRGIAARRDPRRVGVVAPLPGDPREAGDGVLGLQLRARSTRTRAWSGSTSARARRTSSSCLEIVAEQIADIAAGNLRERELERAKENLKGRIALSMESTSNRMSRLGRSLITDTELLSLDRIIAEIDAVEPRSARRAGRRAARARRGCRRPGSARARSASSRRSSASTRGSAAAA